MNFVLAALDGFSRVSVRVILFLVIAFPLVASWLYPYEMNGSSIPVGHTFWQNLAFLTLNKLDSGGQMAMGPSLLRCLLLLAGAVVCAVPRPLDKEWKRPILALLLFHALSLVSAKLCSHPNDAFFCSIDAIMVTLILWLPSTQWSSRDIPKLARLFCSVGLLTIPTNFYQMTLQAASDGQMRGSFFHPTMMATYLLLGLPLLLIFSFSRRSWNIPGLVHDTKVAEESATRLSALYCVLVAASLACLVLSSSRASYATALVCLTLVFHSLRSLEARPLMSKELLTRLGTGAGVVLATAVIVRLSVGSSWGTWLIGLGLLGFWSRPFWNQRERMVKLCMITALVAVFVSTAREAAFEQHSSLPLESRVQSLVAGDDSSTSRISFWKAALAISADYPLLGVGPEGFHRYYPQYQGDLRWFSKFVHSTPLSILVETGWLGLLAFAAAAWWVGALALKRLREEKDPTVRLVRFGLLVGCLSFAMCSLVDVQFQFPILPLSFGFCLGLALIGDPRVDDADEPGSAWSLRPSIVLQQTAAGVMLVFWMLNLSTIPAEYYVMVARMASQTGHHAESAVLAEEACRFSPFEGEYYHQLGLELVADPSKLSPEQQKMLETAAERAMALDSHRAVHYDLKAKILMRAHKPEQALAFNRQALECDPMNYATFYSNAAECQAELGNMAEAREILLACLARFPADRFGSMFDFRSSALNQQFAEVYASLGEIEDPSRNPVLAQTYFAKSVELNPRQFAGQLGLAVSLFQQKKYAEAIPVLERSLKINPTYGPTVNLLIYCNEALGQKEKARTWQVELDRLSAAAAAAAKSKK